MLLILFKTGRFAALNQALRDANFRGCVAICSRHAKPRVSR